MIVVAAAVALLARTTDAATLGNRARLREGPSKDTRLLGWVEAGVSVTIEGERNGWYAVRAPDGQTGFIWQEHLRFEPGEQAAAPAAVVTTIPSVTVTAPPAPPPVPAPTLAPLPDPRAGVTERGDANVGAELERLRGEISQLVTEHKELTQRLARVGHEGGPPVPLATDGSAGAAVLFFAAGGFIGWVIGRFTAGRRERRSRIRL